jgi:hypothetical protein
VPRLLANRTVGAGPPPEWGVAGLSLELDEPSHCGDPVSPLFDSSSLTPGLAGSDSIPAQPGKTEAGRVAAVITRFVINHLVTLIWRNFFRVSCPAVCSTVLDLFSSGTCLVAWPPSLEPGSADSTEAPLATGEGISAVSSFPSTSQESSFVYPSSDGTKLSHAASRQQFLLALVENCSFFAHLVLRCVRAAHGSPNYAPPASVQTGSNFRPTPAVQSKAQPIFNSRTRRSRQNLSAVQAEPTSPQALWVDMACRHLRSSGSSGGMS